MLGRFFSSLFVVACAIVAIGLSIALAMVAWKFILGLIVVGFVGLCLFLTYDWIRHGRKGI